MKYRPDIDGLRALAVLPVVAYHLAAPAMPGGFVGVDVFFVISGYLITGHLRSEIETNRFSILRFYERRLRRIGPALLCLMLFLSAGFAVEMLPAMLSKYGASVLSAVTFSSNFYFWSQTGYFAGAAKAMPLLHTWSLAVEEQYYIVFPILLFWISRFSKRGRDRVLLALLAISLVAASIEAFLYPKSAFYLPHTRAWELLLGAVLALKIVSFRNDAFWRNAAMAVGLALILGSYLLLRTSMPFPGLLALPPCVGAGLILVAGESGDTFLGKVISNRVFVFFGLISYSLYLWHWPLIAFMGTDGALLFGHLPFLLVKGLLLLVSIVAATASWWFVERPFRNRSMVSVRVLLIWTGTATALVAVTAIVFIATKGLPQRFPPSVVAMSNYLDYNPAPAYRKPTCFLGWEDSSEEYKPSRCLTTAPGRNYLIVGDSHAAQLWYGMKSEVRDANFMQATASGCLPLLPLTGAARCTKIIGDAFNYASTHHLTGVIVSGRWRERDLHRVGASMDWWKAHGIKVIFVGPTPEYDMDLPLLLARSILKNDPAMPSRHLQRAIGTTDTVLARIAAAHGTRYVSLYRLLCSGNRCEQQDPYGAPMDFDGSHFTSAGSVEAVRHMAAASQLP